MVSNQDKLESKLGYHFIDSKLLDRAMSHRSFSADNNERLEFLGDSVLGVIVSTILYCLYTETEEGELIKYFTCGYCGHKERKSFNIARLRTQEPV